MLRHRGKLEILHRLASAPPRQLRHDEKEERPGQRRQDQRVGMVDRPFCERLKQVGKVVGSEGVPDTELDRAEGYRYLLATLADAIDGSLYRSDLSDPQLHISITRYRSPAMPSSDARYLNAEITGEGVYRLSGTLGNAPHSTVQAYGGVSALESFDLKRVADAEGRFSVTIGGPTLEGDWMPISPGATLLFFREYFSDWDTARASEFLLERLDRPPRRFL